MTPIALCKWPIPACRGQCYFHDGKIELIEATGLPLGLFEEADYEEFTFQAKPGDMFVFFSDGILDASNKTGEMFGRRRTGRDRRQVLPTSPPIVP